MTDTLEKAKHLTDAALIDFEKYYWSQYTTEKFAKWVDLQKALYDALLLIHIQDINLERAADDCDMSDEESNAEEDEYLGTDESENE